MSLWNCALHGVTGPQACCSTAWRVESAVPSPAGEAPTRCPECGRPRLWHFGECAVMVPATPASTPPAAAPTPTCWLPGGLETRVAEYAVEYPGGRADDVMFHLTTPDGRYMGYLTLGWLREHTSVGDAERSLLSGEGDEDDEP